MSAKERNVTCDIFDAGKADPACPALIVGNREVGFSDLDSAVWGAARHLHRQGARAGMVVALVFRDQVLLACALLGAMRMGATPIVLSPNLAAREREDLIAAADAGFLFTDDRRFVSATVPSFGFDAASTQNGTPADELFCEYPDGFGQIIAGSGSTGKPHLMPLTHRMLRARNQTLASLFPVGPGRRFMLVSPLYFATPIDRMLGSLSAGATCVAWDQKTDIAEAIEGARPDFLHLSVLHAELILRSAARRPGFDLSAIEMVSIGASTVTEDLRRRLRDDLKANLHINYGTNETGTVTFAFPDDLRAARGVVGRPAPGNRVEIVVDDDAPVAPGQIGQVRVQSPGQIEAYVGNASPDRFRDGWFYPRDLATWSEDGQVIHCGRSDHMMILDGLNIYPVEIEGALEEHPAVREAAAFSLPHRVRQDIPVCAVVLADGHTATEQELRDFARERLGVRYPRHVLILDALPRNPQGKVIRGELDRLLRDKLAIGTAPAQPTADDFVSILARVTDNKRRGVAALKFKPPASPRLERLTQWRPHLESRAFPCPPRADLLTFPPDIADKAAWIQHVLDIARDILLLAAFPCFDHFHLIACSPNPDDEGIMKTLVLLPGLENLFPGTIDQALREATSCAGAMAARPPTEENREWLLDRIRRQSLPRLSRGNRTNTSSVAVLHAARQKGIPFRHLGMDVHQLGWGAQAKIINRSSTASDPALAVRLTTNKRVTTALLRQAGLPAPVHHVVADTAGARAAAEQLGWPVVVKPADLERGEGVEVDVTPDRIDAAVSAALELSPGKQVLVERQVSGVCHRLFVAFGQLLYAVKRLPIGVYGDGTSTVAQLVAAAVRADRQLLPWERSKIRPIDDLARRALAANGLTEESVPEAGRFVPLRRIESTRWGGVDEDVTDCVHPENLRVALQAARLCQLEVAGIDIITDDISASWTETGAVINEVNFSPLLGGGDISRSRLGEYVSRLMEGTGRIPVEVFVGDERAMEAARTWVATLKAGGTAAFLTGDTVTLGPDGEDIPVAVDGLPGRAAALILRRDVEALALVVQSDSLLNAPLPLEGVDAVHHVGDPATTLAGAMPAQRIAQLQNLLSIWTWPD
ncbi:AMP-binding protein [Jhaorihella thermophila]|uniref:Acyl-CoA synthetase (AMP-forming)/AMP-acid ligase II n=2 Tax=Jhaorihella thermophila TaxID=488547 RepID=A0A1H5VZ69_9RHOB|nr:AMP-binding protein [Jhaorihella thermophila]SEF92564.1 Acyl-CoA synthetase (AMP-forming)/AMP-acid ligase II [Jhaorihella thermophila]